jgi:hypothetical protein
MIKRKRQKHNNKGKEEEARHFCLFLFSVYLTALPAAQITKRRTV